MPAPGRDIARKQAWDMSTKQWAKTVQKGQLITFHIFDSEDVIGYLAGVDERYFFILEPRHDGFVRKLVRREANPVMVFHEAPTFNDEGEPFYEEMDKIIRPFRIWVADKIFGNGSGSDQRERITR